MRTFALAEELGSVRAACRMMGIHHSTYYRWKDQAERYGLELMRPRERRQPRMPNATSPLVEQRVVDRAPFVDAPTTRRSTVYTDEWRAYRSVRRRRRAVRQGAGKYVDGRVHTNSIESFWAIVKRTVMGTYHWLSWKQLHRYVAEFTGRFNNRLQRRPRSDAAPAERPLRRSPPLR